MTTIKQYLLDNYESTTIEDITKHGCISGICSGLIYYNDTCKFYDLHQEEIWELLHENASNLGYSIMQLIAEFNGQKNVGSDTQFKNLLVWYAVEEIANSIVNEWESNEQNPEDY